MVKSRSAEKELVLTRKEAFSGTFQTDRIYAYQN